MGVGWGREQRDKGGERGGQEKEDVNSLLGDVVSHLLGFSYAAQPF